MPPPAPPTCAAAVPSISTETAAVLASKNLIAIFLSVWPIRSPSSGGAIDQHPS